MGRPWDTRVPGVARIVRTVLSVLDTQIAKGAESPGRGPGIIHLMNLFRTTKDSHWIAQPRAGTWPVRHSQQKREISRSNAHLSIRDRWPLFLSTTLRV